jgi:uncharacterized protein YhaN
MGFWTDVRDKLEDNFEEMRYKLEDNFENARDKLEDNFENARDKLEDNSEDIKDIIKPLALLPLVGIQPLQHIIIAQKLKNLNNKYRKEIEDKADEFNPEVGKKVKAFHNYCDFAGNALDSFINKPYRILFAPEVKELNLADHLFVQRSCYTHHALFIGDGSVIHYILEEGVTTASLEEFAKGAKIQKKSESDSPRKYPRDEVIDRAWLRMCEQEYNLVVNNCESLVRWCRSGGDER